MVAQQTGYSDEPMNPAAYLAAGWSFLFALISVYWVTGGKVGIDTLAQSIQDDARNGDRGMLLLTWITGGLKMAGGVLMLALVRPWGERLPGRLRLVSGYAVGAALTLYGFAGFIEKLLMELDLIGVPASLGEDAVRWYLFLWEPFWLLGGLLYLLASRRFQIQYADRLRA